VIKVKLYEKSMKLKGEKFKQIIGVTKETYEEMLEVLTEAYSAKHVKGGRPSKLQVCDQLFLALKYWRQYITQLELSFEFEVGEATVHDTIVWVENTLISCGRFSLPGKKALLDENNEIDVIIVDVTESPIERPKKNNASGTLEKRRSTPSKRK
jgi:hypothetical protein